MHITIPLGTTVVAEIEYAYWDSKQEKEVYHYASVNKPVKLPTIPPGVLCDSSEGWYKTGMLRISESLHTQPPRFTISLRLA